MKRIRYIMSVLMMWLMAAWSLCAYAQDSGTIGQEFWVTFPRVTDHKPSNEVQCKLIITALGDGFVHISYAGGSMDVFVHAGRNEVTISPTSAVYNFESDRIYPTGVYVQSDIPVSIVALAETNIESEATALLPQKALGTDYVIQGYDGSFAKTSFQIVATEDNTTVKMWMPDAVVGHDHEGQYMIRLNRGETYQAFSDGKHSVTGTMISSDKPIAVFNGNYEVQESWFSFPNFLWEQAVPVTALGQRFVLTRGEGHKEDYVRFTAVLDGTIITVEGKGIRLDAGESFTYSLNHNAVYVESNQPVICYQYFTASPSMVYITPLEQATQGTFFSTGNTWGIFQYLSTVTVDEPQERPVVDDSYPLSTTPIPNNPYKYHNGNVGVGAHTLHSEKYGTLVGYIYGYDILNSYAYTVAGKYELLNKLLLDKVISTRTHDVTIDSCMNQIEINGKVYTASGDYWDTIAMEVPREWEVRKLHIHLYPSYFITQDTTLYGNQTIVWEGRLISRGGTYTRAYPSQHGCDSVMVLKVKRVPDGSIDTYDTICYRESYAFRNHTFSLTQLRGATEPKDIVLEVRDRTDCMRYRRIVHVMPTRSYHDAYVEIRHGDRYWFGNKWYSKEGEYTHTFSSSYGCDSVVTLHLSHNAPVITNQQASFCAGDSYEWLGHDTVFTMPGLYTDTLKAKDGCDSIVRLTLTAHESFHHTFKETIRPDEVPFSNAVFKNITKAGLDSVVGQNRFGCDSIYYLDLSICLPSDTLVLDTIVEGESLDVEGLHITTGGDHKATFVKADGCDSVVTHRVTVLQKQTYTLTVTSNDKSLGTATGGGTGIHGGKRCTITAVPKDDCSLFTGWDDGVTDNPRDVIVDSDKSYVAMFEKVKYTVTVISDDDATGTVSATITR